MWWNIFMTIYGAFIILMVAAVAGHSFYNYKNCFDELKKAWRRSFEGWAVLTCLILFDFTIRIVKWIYN